MKLKRTVRNRIEATGKSTLAVMLAFTLTLGLGLGTALATDSAQGEKYPVLGATTPEAEALELESDTVADLGYTFDAATGMLTITSNSGTDAWRTATPAIAPTDVKGVDIKAGVTGINKRAFLNCINMTSVTLPEGLKTIGQQAFADCQKLPSIVFPEGLETIGIAVFSNNFALTAPVIPDSVTAIGDAAFIGCQGMGTVTMESSIPSSLGVDAFANMEENWPKIMVPYGSLDTYKSAAGWSAYRDRIFEQKVITGDYIFDPSDGSLQILKNEGTTSWRDIVEAADVRSISFGPDVTKILVLASGEGAFEGSAVESVTIPSNVLGVGSSAFKNCKSLKSVTIQSASGEIGTSAFSGCSALESLAIHQGVTILGASAFMDSTALRSVSIPEGVTQIGGECFKGASLTSVTIPASVTNIGNEAFAKVSTFVVLGKTPAKLGVISLGNIDSLPTGFVIKVPLDALDVYKTTWAYYKDYIVGVAPAPEPTPEPKPLPVGGGGKLASTGDPLSVLPIVGISLAAMAGVALALARKKVLGK